MKVAFLLALFAPLAFAQFVACPTGQAYADVCGVAAFNCGSNDALTFISITFMFVATAIALAYMYSKFREDAAAGVWAKDEAYNLLISVLLFAGILVFFTGSCSIAYDYSGESPFDASQGYLRQLLQANGLNVLRSLTAGSIGNQLDATYQLWVGFPPAFGGGVAGRADLRAHSALKEFLIDLYLPIVASLNAQMYILQAIQWVAASVLLPFAFVMRLFPFTREFGNVLIAVFFGLYIVVPTMYAMSGRVFMEQISPPAPLECVDCSINSFASYGLDEQGAPATSTVFYAIGSTIPQAIFLPNLVIAVAISCVMALSKALRALAV